MKKVFQPIFEVISMDILRHYNTASYDTSLQQKKQECYEPFWLTLVVSFFQERKVWHIHFNFS